MPAIIYKNKEGDRVPSVTTILNQWGANKQPLINWAWKQGEAGVSLYEKPEADVGTLAHMMIDYEVKGKKLDLGDFPMDIQQQAKVCYQNWQRWKARNEFKPIKTELSLVSEKHQYGGTLDIVAVINNALTIADLKTGREVYEDHIIQLVAYKQLWEENFPDSPINGGFQILRTGKEIAMFSDNWYGEFPGAWQVFSRLRAIYDLHKEIKKLK